MMTAEEYNKREQEILCRIPHEFHSAVSYYAYESGHSAGYEEVLIHLENLADMLVAPVQAFALRLRKAYTDDN